MKKNILILAGAILLVILAGFFIRQANTTKFQPETLPAKPTAKPEITIPKVTSYKVPILMYHYIRDAAGEDELGQNLSVSPENFGRQMQYLAENDFAPVKLADLADPELKAISKVYNDKKKPIVLTFDDGYEDAYSAAWPVLKKYDFFGTFFIIRNFVGKEMYMTQIQIDQLAAAGMEIGSHSLSHPDLAKADAADAREQIFDSKKEAQVFCYPAGKYNDTTVRLLKEAGYIAAVTTKAGIADEKSDLFELSRVRIQNISLEAFKQKLNYE